MVGMLHVGVFILLMLSGERNFGVRLNKPFNVRLAMDIPKFTGTHADLLFLVRLELALLALLCCILQRALHYLRYPIAGVSQDHYLWSITDTAAV